MNIINFCDAHSGFIGVITLLVTSVTLVYMVYSDKKESQRYRRELKRELDALNEAYHGPMSHQTITQELTYREAKIRGLKEELLRK